jgi:hypothetical protein
MAIRERERQVARALRRFLMQREHRCHWRPGADPPDFVFYVDGERWAVEETRLEQYIESDKGAMESRTIEASLARTLNELGRGIESDLGPKLTTGYLINVWAPTNALKGARLRPVRAKAVAYVESGKSEWETLDSDGRVRIRRVGGPRRISRSFGLHASVRGADGSSLSADIAASVRHALTRILAEKTPSVSALSGYQRKLLVISKGYLFADPPEVRSVIGSMAQAAAAFDAVAYFTKDRDLGYMYETDGTPQGEIVPLTGLHLFQPQP